MTDELLEQFRAVRAEFTEHVTENRVAHEMLTKELQRHGKEEERIHAQVFGVNGSPGLLERMRSQERFAASLRKVFWVLMTAVLLSSLGLVLQALRWYVAEAP